MIHSCNNKSLRIICVLLFTPYLFHVPDVDRSGEIDENDLEVTIKVLFKGTVYRRYTRLNLKGEIRPVHQGFHPS